MNAPKRNPVIKVILLGESGVGKTSLINATIGIEFNSKEEVTFINSYVDKKYDINNQTFYLQIWDTIGQEKYRQLTKLFFKDAKIVILVYDKSNEQSFNEIDYWAKEVRSELGDNIILALVANKDDLEEKNEDVDENIAEQYAKKINSKFKSVSAKLNAKGFEYFLKELLTDYINKYGNEIMKNNGRISLIKETKKKKKNCSKCK